MRHDHPAARPISAKVTGDRWLRRAGPETSAL